MSKYTEYESKIRVSPEFHDKLIRSLQEAEKKQDTETAPVLSASSSKQNGRNGRLLRTLSVSFSACAAAFCLIYFGFYHFAPSKFLDAPEGRYENEQLSDERDNSRSGGKSPAEDAPQSDIKSPQEYSEIEFNQKAEGTEHRAAVSERAAKYRLQQYRAITGDDSDGISYEDIADKTDPSLAEIIEWETLPEKLRMKIESGTKESPNIRSADIAESDYLLISENAGWFYSSDSHTLIDAETRLAYILSEDIAAELQTALNEKS